MKIKYVTSHGEETIQPEPLACGSIISGTTVGNAPGSFISCGNRGAGSRRPAIAPSVYFKLEGASGDTEINLCGSSFDIQVSVFREECDGRFECVGGNEGSKVCGDVKGSLYTILDANPDDVYAVIVHGKKGRSAKKKNEGDYKLAVNCGTALPDTMDMSPEMAQTMKEKEEMMQTEGCAVSERVCPASAGK